MTIRPILTKEGRQRFNTLVQLFGKSNDQLASEALEDWLETVGQARIEICEERATELATA